MTNTISNVATAIISVANTHNISITVTTSSPAAIATTNGTATGATDTANTSNITLTIIINTATAGDNYQLLLL
jgi:hypothetical protein